MRVLIIKIKTVSFCVLYAFLLCSVLSCQASEEMIQLSVESIQKGGLTYIDFPNCKAHQSMAVYGESVFFITPRNGILTCNLYNARNSSYSGNVELPFDRNNNALPHANVSCFGKLFYSESSLFPCLYVSQWNDKRLAFVYDFKNNGSSIVPTLVQVIDPSHLDKAVLGYGNLDWVIDDSGDYLYTVAYKRFNSALESKDNAINIVKFPLPDPRENNYVFLENNEILDAFEVPIMNATQDKCFINGYLYVASGYSDPNFFFPNNMFRIDVIRKELRKSPIILRGEPEGLSCYDGRLVMNLDNDSGRVYFVDHYLDGPFL